jgi:hypothetical protein
MIDPILTVIAFLGVVGQMLTVAALVCGRRSEAYGRVWRVAVFVLLGVVVALAAHSVAKWSAGPPPERGALNPGGPSGSVLAAIGYVAILYLGTPGAFIAIAVLACLPPLGAMALMQGRIRSVLVAITLLAATVSVAALRAHTRERREQRSQDVHHTPFDRFEAYREDDE